MDIRRAVTVGVLLTAGVVLAGCSVPDADTERTAAPSASASSPAPSASPTPGAGAAADEALLPLPVGDIADWAETAVPRGETEGYAVGYSGWISENSSPNQTSNFASLAPGSYQAQFACRGDGEITITTAELDAEPTGEPVVCTDSTIAFDITTEATGLTVKLALDGAPTIFAFSLVRMS